MAWIEITTRTPCKNNCDYCPQDKLRRNYTGKKELSLEDFKHALKNVPLNVEVHFSGFSEPFQNESCVDMILYANQKGYKIRLYTTLVGLTLEQGRRLDDVPFKHVRIHDIKQHIHPFKWVNDYSPVTNIVSRAGNLKPTKKKQVTQCVRCPDYDHPVMLPNCDCVLCCQDYSLTVPLGNLLNTPFENLVKKAQTFAPHEICRGCEYAK